MFIGMSLRYPLVDSTSQDRTADIICPEEDDDSTILSHWTYLTLYFIDSCPEKEKKNRNIIENVVVL